MSACRVTALFLILILASCSKSPLEQCIDDQMAAWAMEYANHQEMLEARERYEAQNGQQYIEVDGVQVPFRAFLPAGPPSEEQARASASLKCGAAYSN